MEKEINSLREKLSEVLENKKTRSFLNALLLASAMKREGVDTMRFVCERGPKGLQVKDLRVLLLCSVELEVCKKLAEVKENLASSAPFRMLPKEINEKVFNTYEYICEQVEESNISFSEYFDNIGRYEDIVAYIYGQEKEERDPFDGKEFESIKEKFGR